MLNIVNPRQTALISSRGNAEIMGKDVHKDNIITLDWHMPCSFDPMLYAISVGKTRFSCQLIKNSQVFIVNFVSKKQEKEAVICGRQSGMHVDKFKEANFTKIEGQHVDCPRIKEAVAWMECQVINEIDAGDHVIFLGKVLVAEMNPNNKDKDNIKRLFHAEGNKFTTTEN